jgi:integrase
VDPSRLISGCTGRPLASRGRTSDAGLRPGEALALQWRDIREQAILVERAISLGKKKDTKTAAHRTVRLLPPLANDLREWRLRSGRPGEATLVFPSAASAPWSKAAYQSWRRRAFERAIEAEGWSTAARMT